MERFLGLFSFGTKHKFYTKKGKLPMYLDVQLSQNFPCVGSLIKIKAYSDQSKAVEKGIKCRWLVRPGNSPYAQDIQKIHDLAQSDQNSQKLSTKKSKKTEFFELKNKANNLFLSVIFLGMKISLEVKEYTDRSNWGQGAFVRLDFCRVGLMNQSLFFKR